MVFKKYVQLFILALFIPLCGLNIFAQDGLGSYVLRAKNGYLLVQNREKISFTIEFKGEVIKPLKSDHPMFLIDGKLMQVVTVSNEDFFKSKGDSVKEPTSEQVLEAHKIWESEYLGGVMKSKLSVTSEFLESSQRRKAMFWSFPMPKELNSTFSHQLFLTTVIGKEVLVLNTSSANAEGQKSYRDLLLESMKTLKTSEKRFNIKDISESLKQEN